MIPQLSPEEKQKRIKLAMQAGFPEKWAEDVVNKIQWLQYNRANLATSHALTIVTSGKIIPFDVFCHLVWISIGRKEFNEQQQAALN